MNSKSCVQNAHVFLKLLLSDAVPPNMEGLPAAELLEDRQRVECVEETLLPEPPHGRRHFRVHAAVCERLELRRVDAGFRMKQCIWCEQMVGSYPGDTGCRSGEVDCLLSSLVRRDALEVVRVVSGLVIASVARQRIRKVAVILRCQQGFLEI